MRSVLRPTLATTRSPTVLRFQGPGDDLDPFGEPWSRARPSTRHEILKVAHPHSSNRDERGRLAA